MSFPPSGTGAGAFIPSGGLRVPPLRYLAVLAFTFLVSTHFVFSYSSDTYADHTSVDAVKSRLGFGGGTTASSTWSSGKKELGLSPFTEHDRASSGHNTSVRANAAFVILARNSDVWEIVESIRGMEDRFNKKYNYPFVFLNDQPFSDEFKKYTSGIASSACTYGQIPADHWDEQPVWIDQVKAKAAREEMERKEVIYGGSLSYRKMCRYQSGFFWRHELLDKYEYYWRIEPHVKYFCDLDYDPFMFMQTNKKKYGFTVTLKEYAATIPTLWAETKEFITNNPQHLAKPNLMDWLSNDGGETYNTFLLAPRSPDGQANALLTNLCHAWSNFEIGSLDFWRGDAYRAYFEHLDRAGGFFYERWGDAPVHSIAAALFLKPEEIHFFQDIGYRHEPFQHCPKGMPGKCACNPDDANNFEDHWYSCTPKFKQLTGWKGT